MCTKLGFPLVPMPSYFPCMHELEQSNIKRIEDTAFVEAKRVEREMLVIMDELQENQEQHDVSNASSIVLFPGFTQMNLMIWDMD